MGRPEGLAIPHSLCNAWSNILTCHFMANLHTGPLAPILTHPSHFQADFRDTFTLNNMKGPVGTISHASFSFSSWGQAAHLRGLQPLSSFPSSCQSEISREGTGWIQCAKTRATVYLQSQSPHIRSHQQLQQCALDNAGQQLPLEEYSYGERSDLIQAEHD